MIQHLGARDGGQPTRVLVAADDSPAALRATRLAVAVAATAGCPLLVVTVVRDGTVTRALGQATSEPLSEQRRRAAASSMVRHALHLAQAAGVVVEGREESGEPGRCLLAVAREWGADLVVIGRSEASSGTFGRVGDVALHVLELSDVPVLVVP
jgi:nucleotide-binding universal stress UspA family protein